MRRSKLGVGFRVAAWLGVSMLLLGACSSGEGDQAYCATFESRLRECELIGSGRFDACVNYGDKAEACETRCLREASCIEMGFFFCPTEGDNEVSKCFRGCSGIDPSNEGLYKCRNVDETVLWEFYCDGASDCSDGSDEPPDCAPAASCGDDSPVSIWDFCDGQADCADGADEPAGCVTSACPTL